MARSMLLLVMLLHAPAAAQDWSDWECPGFPCYIANYFDHRSHDKPSQTCGFVGDYNACNNLVAGTSFDAVNADGSIAGTHDLKGQAHPCMNQLMGGCVQTSCIQKTEQGCHAACDALNMLDNYAAACHDHCSYGECKGL